MEPSSRRHTNGNLSKITLALWGLHKNCWTVVGNRHVAASLPHKNGQHSHQAVYLSTHTLQTL